MKRMARTFPKEEKQDHLKEEISCYLSEVLETSYPDFEGEVHLKVESEGPLPKKILPFSEFKKKVKPINMCKIEGIRFEHEGVSLEIVDPGAFYNLYRQLYEDYLQKVAWNQ